jgi:hypothetical protein
MLGSVAKPPGWIVETAPCKRFIATGIDVLETTGI